jgi:hypothetical protein
LVEGWRQAADSVKPGKTLISGAIRVARPCAEPRRCCPPEWPEREIGFLRAWERDRLSPGLL